MAPGHVGLPHRVWQSGDKGNARAHLCRVPRADTAAWHASVWCGLCVRLWACGGKHCVFPFNLRALVGQPHVRGNNLQGYLLRVFWGACERPHGDCSCLFVRCAAYQLPARAGRRGEALQGAWPRADRIPFEFGSASSVHDHGCFTGGDARRTCSARGGHGGHGLGTAHL